MAASIHLARAGLSVVCVEPAPDSSPVVGESLDWSAPDLLAELGLPPEYLLANKIATCKTHVMLRVSDGSTRDYIPGQWLGRPPWNVELRTLHIDRAALREELRRIVLSHGIALVRDRGTSIETAGQRIIALHTAGGERMVARWFVDASGLAASLLPRHFHSPARMYGRQKVAIWNYFTASHPVDGTTIFSDCPRGHYMEWIWAIPINPSTIGVGYVAPAESIKARRQRGLSMSGIFSEEVGRIPDLAALLAGAHLPSPHVTSYRCRAHTRITGPNWIVIGESACMIDPMTSNGVTAALRHAREAAHLIIRSRRRQRLPRTGIMLYRRRTLDLARFFNVGIERVAYDWPIRDRVGPLAAGDVYTIPAWLFNLVYARLDPRGVFTTALCCSTLAFLCWAASAMHWACRRFPRHATGSGATS
jgi:flavin-dependent dehydrogenase